MISKSLAYEASYDPIYAITKQAALSGTDPAALSFLIQKSASIGPLVLEELQPRWDRDNIKVANQDIKAFEGKDINPENELFQKVAHLNDLAVDILETWELYKKAYKALDESNPLEKYAATNPEPALNFIGRSLYNLFQFGKRHPILAVGTGAVAATAGVSAIKNKNKPTTGLHRTPHSNSYKRIIA